MKKLLIIYYSWSNGNTERIAKMLQSETDSDILKIDTVVPYSGSYDDVVNQGQNEVQCGYEPEIKPLDINIADYDVIAVGTPTWWYTMTPAVKTFLHQQDFTGKTVVPFMTNGGWPGHVIKDMKAACKGANVVCDMQIQFDSTGGSNLETPQEQINEWIQSVKIFFKLWRKNMTIKEVSEKYGISQDTLRYYERVNVIPKVTRTSGGIRDYLEEDLRWVELAVCMRNAGLPIESLIEYQRLFRAGDSTIPARLELLNEQMDILQKQKEQIEGTMDRLSYKISRYEEAVKTGKLVWTKEE